MKPVMKLLLIGLLAFSGNRSGAEVIVGFASYCAGKKLSFDVRRVDLEAAPSWKQAREYPPLSPRRAAQAAGTFLRRIQPDYHEWVLSAITLEPTPLDNKWIYLVKYRAPVGREGLKGRMEFLEVPVLMNGQVADPTI